MYRLIFILVLTLGLLLADSNGSGNAQDMTNDPTASQTDNTDNTNNPDNTNNTNSDNTSSSTTGNYDNTNAPYSSDPNASATNTETYVSPIDGTEMNMPQRDKSSADELLKDAGMTNYDNAVPSKKLSKEEKEELEKIREAAKESEKKALLYLEKKKGEKSSIDIAIDKWNSAGMGEDMIRAQWLKAKKHIDEGESDKAIEIAKAAIEQATNSNLEGSGMALAFHAMAEAQYAKGEDKKAERYQMFAETAAKNIVDKDIRAEIEGLIKD